MGDASRKRPHVEIGRRPKRLRLVEYSRARSEIRNGDLLLMVPTTYVGRKIAWGTRSDYSHAAMAGYEPNGPDNPEPRLRALEMLQFRGGRHKLLSEYVRQYPKVIDVYRPVPPYDGDASVAWMLWLCGKHYGWFDFAMIVTRRGFGWVLPMPTDSPDPDLPRICSAAVAYGAHYGGGKKIHANLPDLMVFPGELATPGFSAYHLTLVPFGYKG